MRVKQMIIHSNLSKMKKQNSPYLFTKELKGQFGRNQQYSTSYGVFGTERGNH